MDDTIRQLERKIDELGALVALLAMGRQIPAGSLPEGMSATGPDGETVTGTEFGPKEDGAPIWSRYPRKTLVTLG